jgi:predicted TIM-barrel fold metal-dependent hydrolase
MTAGGFRVLDVHHHVGDAMQALAMPGAATAPAPPGLERDMQIRLETMDRDGIDGSVLIPGHSYLRPQGLADTRRINDGIAAYRDAAPERFRAALGIVEPLYGRAGDEELRRIKDELGLVGVSFHTRFQGVATDSPLLLAQLEVIGELGLVPFIHSVAESSEEALWRVQRVARAFPDLTMIVLDPFSSHEQSSHAMLVAELAPNLVFDTSLAYTIDPILRLIDRFGHQRVVFGTDLYSYPLGYHHSTVLAHLLASGLEPHVLQDVLADTAEALLGLGAVGATGGVSEAGPG